MLFFIISWYGVFVFDLICSALILPFTSSPAPKLVFNGLNKKKLHTQTTPQVDAQAEGFTPSHEENVKFVYEGKCSYSPNCVLFSHVLLLLL